MSEFDDIKVGDIIIVDGRYNPSKAQVTKVTATRFVASKLNFSKKSGRAAESDKWNPIYAHTLTPDWEKRYQESQAELQKQRKITELHRIELGEASAEQIEKLYGFAKDLGLIVEPKAQ